VLVDGTAAGLWERKKLAKRIEIEIRPARRLNRTEVRHEAERYATFLGVELALTVE
jgi:hypothetical protein